MSPRRFHPNNAEAFNPNTLSHNDFLLDDPLAQWTNEVGNELFNPQAAAACGVSGNKWVVPNGAFDIPAPQDSLTQDSTFDSLFLPQIGSPQVVAGAEELFTEQINAITYPENPSLTTGSWVWVPDATVTTQYEANPSSFGGINIDPALLALDTPYPSNPTRTPQYPFIQPREPLLSPAHSSSPPFPPPPSRKRKQAPTTHIQPPSKRTRPSRALPKDPSLSLPLSLLPAVAHIPLKDVAAHIKRPVSTRRTDAAYSRNRKHQAIPRPSNSFMLYRMAYTDRIQALIREADNHQVVSSVAGESWRMETMEVTDEFKELAEVEKVWHAKAWPNYRYQPTLK